MIIRKRIIHKKEYYYLEHSFKVGKSVKKKEKYLGKDIPKDIDSVKAKFMLEIRKEKWYKDLDTIKQHFSNDYNSMPRSGKEKYTENFMITFTYNSNRIEGSSITLKETARLLEDGIAPKKPLKDIKETEAHKKVFYEMMDCKKDLSLNMVLFWHKHLFESTDSEIAGRIRNHGVNVAGSKSEFPIPAELDVLLREFFQWYNKNKDRIHPVELSALVHLKFVSIHPFTDGNGRISRIMMNFVLKKFKYPMLNIAYRNRDTYYTALERSQVKRIDYIFIQHLIKRYVREYRQYC